MYYVYIIKSLKTGELYKGLTNNIERRLNEHVNGESRTTRHKLPFTIIHIEICPDRYSARKVEKFFKSGYGREVLKEIEENNGAVAKW